MWLYIFVNVTCKIVKEEKHEDINLFLIGKSIPFPLHMNIRDTKIYLQILRDLFVMKCMHSVLECVKGASIYKANYKLIQNLQQMDVYAIYCIISWHSCRNYAYNCSIF